MKPLGYLATLLWGVFAFVVSQTVGVLVLWWLYRGDAAALAAEPYNGVAITLVTLATNAVEVALLVSIVALWRQNVGEYLALGVPRADDVKLAVVSLALFIVGGDAVIYLANQQIVPPFEAQAYQTARASGWLLALAFAAIVVAPVGEELLFRGFLFRGWIRSQRRAWIGIAVISMIFAGLHVQYDAVGMLQIFGVGLLLGWLRWRSGSTLLTIGCHAFVNFESSVETFVKVHWFP